MPRGGTLSFLAIFPEDENTIRPMNVGGRGAYLSLFFHYVRSDGILPADPDELARISGARADQWQGIWNTIGRHFFQREGLLWNDRFDRELRRSRDIKARKQRGADITNNKRWGTPLPDESLSDSLSDRNTKRIAQRIALSSSGSESLFQTEKKRGRVAERLARRGPALKTKRTFGVKRPFQPTPGSALVQAQASGTWSTLGLVGLFHSLYKQALSIEYRHGGRATEFECVETLVAATGTEMAEWCIRALFAPDMDWVKNKGLEFFTPSNISGRVIGVAKQLKHKKATNGEWKRGKQKLGVISSPKGWEESDISRAPASPPAKRRAASAAPRLPFGLRQGLNRAELIAVAIRLGAEKRELSGRRSDDICALIHSLRRRSTTKRNIGTVAEAG
jgi:uncharacterized protein YdaU (DUF1376 family)